MTTVTDQFQKMLDEFDRNNDIASLEAAIDAIDSMEESKYNDIDSYRKEKLLKIMALFNSIDSKLIVNFNFDDAPDMNVAPAPETGLPPGVTVDSIHDPKLKSMYEQDLLNNQVKVQKYNFQLKLDKLNKLLIGNFKEHIQVYYTKKASDLLEIETVVNKEIIMEKRKNILNTILVNP